MWPDRCVFVFELRKLSGFRRRRHRHLKQLPHLSNVSARCLYVGLHRFDVANEVFQRGRRSFFHLGRIYQPAARQVFDVFPVLF
jgi:hypothetical protein